MRSLLDLQRQPVHVAALAGIALALGACSSGPPPAISERPSCVTLPAYGSVIEQIMGVYPDWTPLQITKDGYEASWLIEAEGATHRLTATLTRRECICATVATSRFPSGSPQAEFAGYLQGAAVAPLSDLEDTASWLEPKVLFRCPLAFFLRDQFVSSETMEDGTFWRLECERRRDPAFADLEFSFAVATEECRASVP